MSSASRINSWRTLIAAGVVILMVHLAESKDVLSDFTRPTVVSTLHLMGISAHDKGEMIAVGHLSVPWTRDCAGLNLILILLALAVWVNRTESFNARYVTRLLLMIPAALVANVARVLTLVAYRQTFFPAVESPQLHYFMGLAWLVPFVTFVIPSGSRPKLWVITEAIHASAVVALLAPMSGTPNGSIVTIAVVLALAHSKVQGNYPVLRLWLCLPWLLAGIAISVMGMESFWLPWLLVCPALLDINWILNPIRWIIIAACNPMFILLPGAVYAAYGAIALTVWQWFQNNGGDATDSSTIRCYSSRLITAQLALIVVSFAMPFMASTVMAHGFEKIPPPRGIECDSIGNEGYQLRLPGQPDNIAMIWYGPTSTDRHHTVKVCLKYRGIELTNKEGSDDIFTDGNNIVREFFLQGQDLLHNYKSYIVSTFKPGASPGVHIIFVAPKNSISTIDFDKNCQSLARRLLDRCYPNRTIFTPSVL